RSVDAGAPAARRVRVPGRTVVSAPDRTAEPRVRAVVRAAAGRAPFAAGSGGSAGTGTAALAASGATLGGRSAPCLARPGAVVGAAAAAARRAARVARGGAPAGDPALPRCAHRPAPHSGHLRHARLGGSPVPRAADRSHRSRPGSHRAFVNLPSVDTVAAVDAHALVVHGQ